MLCLSLSEFTLLCLLVLASGALVNLGCLVRVVIRLPRPPFFRLFFSSFYLFRLPALVRLFTPTTRSLTLALFFWPLSPILLSRFAPLVPFSLASFPLLILARLSESWLAL
jgi:hypothetical protein